MYSIAVHYPWMCEQMTSGQYENAKRIVEHVKIMIKDRETAAATMAERERSFVLSAGNWAPDSRTNGYIPLVECVLSGEYSVLNRLRWFSQQFCGYSPAALRGGPGSPPPTFPNGLSGPIFMENELRNGESCELTRQVHEEMLRHRASSEVRYVHAYEYFTSLLPKRFRLCLAPILGETGFICDGRGVINYEAFLYMRFLVCMAEAGVFAHLDRCLAAGRAPKILEIGGGFGGLAYLVSRAYPDASYTICDILESLVYSAIYLSVAAGADAVSVGTEQLDMRGNFKLISNRDFYHHHLDMGNFDLAINTASFNEMASSQVQLYGEFISEILREDGILFEINSDTSEVNASNVGRILPAYFAHYKAVGTDDGLLRGAIARVWAGRCEP
jgi:hypothetical protein